MVKGKDELFNPKFNYLKQIWLQPFLIQYTKINFGCIKGLNAKITIIRNKNCEKL